MASDTKPHTNRMGFDALDDDDFTSGGYDGDGGGKKPFDFFISVDPDRGKVDGRKAVVFLDDDPAMVWEHDLYSITRQMGDRVYCLAKNGNDDRCPLCELDKDLKAIKDKNGKQKYGIWSKLVGYLTVLDCGDVVRDKLSGEVKLVPYTKGEKRYIFNKKLLRANKGSKDKPGMLNALRRLKEESKNRLTGRAFYAYRQGKLFEGIGNEYRPVENGDFLAAWKGLDPDSPESVEAANAKLCEFLAAMEGSPAHGADDKMLEYTDILPVDYDTHIFAAKSVPELEKLSSKLRAQVGLPPLGNESYSGSGGQTGGDEEVPF